MAALKEIAHQILGLTREAGTPEAATARELVATYLTDLGYTVISQTFTFAPSSLRAFPIFGAGLGGLSLVLFPFLYSSNPPHWAALALWVVGLFSLTTLATGVGLGWVTLGEGLREDANLIATRGESAPRRWIVAHLDSKAQGHSMAGRLVAVWVVGLAVVSLTALAIARLNGALSPVSTGVGVLLAIVAGVLAGRGRLKGRSHGARDNGTGVVAALAAAAASAGPVGILITGAEEFGLVGARVFVRSGQISPGVEFVNVDTVDQEGRLYIISHNESGSRLAAALVSTLEGLGLPIRLRRLPLGIFVDSAPLSRLAPSVTIGRLTWRTLRCIHTPADISTGLSFRTAEQVGKAIASN
ncbi:MAG TPA: M28 family peptidase [Gemmatimonadales bacterium]|nr:M28 family peptidase [Gemmatimonadales bacterium]